MIRGLPIGDYTNSKFQAPTNRIWNLEFDFLEEGRYVAGLAVRSAIRRRNVLRLYMSPDLIGALPQR